MNENFIRLWESVISPNVCEEIINSFELNLDKAKEGSSNKSNLIRKDSFIEMSEFNKPDLIELVANKVWGCMQKYMAEFGQLQNTQYTNNYFKVQKTDIRGGFHNWHYEKGNNQESVSREIVWTVYLNTMPPNEAETEFLYQSLKVRPVSGTVCLFPAAMTHVHRGLTVYTQPKYILTGWFSKVLNSNF